MRRQKTNQWTEPNPILAHPRTDSKAMAHHISKWQQAVEMKWNMSTQSKMQRLLLLMHIHWFRVRFGNSLNRQLYWWGELVFRSKRCNMLLLYLVVRRGWWLHLCWVWIHCPNIVIWVLWFILMFLFLLFLFFFLYYFMG